MKNIVVVIILVAFFSCKKRANQKTDPNNPIVFISADAETEAVASSDDAADDPAVWVHKEDALKSIIIGTDKQYGLIAYSLDGKIIKEYPVGRVNNVDVRTRIQLGNSIISIAAASNRTHNSINVFRVNEENGDLEPILAKELKSNLPEVYGFCLYYNIDTHYLAAFVVGKEGGVEEWSLSLVSGKVEGKLKRTFQVGSQAEGMVADDYYGHLYIGEENVALWRYDLNTGGVLERKKVATTEDANMSADFEGVALYDKGMGEGYIIVSSQGNNSYAMFDRKTNKYLKSFSLIEKNKIDGTNDTDGIDVSAVSFGKKYPKGFFIAQDGENTDGKTVLTQNFKIVDWRKIEAKIN